MHIMKTHDIHPDLDEGHLTEVALLVKQAYHSAAISSEPEMGDTPWCRGCVAYDRARYAIRRAADRLPWLSVIDGTMHFVFAIGKVPLRFFHGDSSAAPSRYLIRHGPEIRAQQLAFEFMAGAEQDVVLRIAMETNETGEATSATLLRVSHDGVTLDCLRIPLSTRVTPMHKPKDSVDVGPPAVGVRRDARGGEESAGHRR